MVSLNNPEDMEWLIDRTLRRGSTGLDEEVYNEVYGKKEPPEMLDTEDFVEDYKVNVNDGTLCVSADMGDIEYNFSNAETDTEEALEIFSGVFHNIYEGIIFPVRKYDGVENVEMTVVGEEGILVHKMNRKRVLELDDQAKENIEFRDRGDSPMETCEEAELSEERANLYLEHLLENGEYISFS